MTKKVNQKFMIPMEVSKETAEALGIKKEQIVIAKLGFKKVPVVYVECNKKVYDTYMRSLWTEEQQEYRSKKCIITSEKTGKPIRCKGNCSTCKEYGGDMSGTLSLDSLLADENIAFDIEDKNVNTEREVESKVMLEDIIKYLTTININYANIFLMMYDGCTEREIAKVQHKSQSTIHDTIASIQKILQKRYKREDFIN